MDIGTPHILVVDDESVNLEIIADHLEDSNYRLSFAEDGNIAWKILESDPESFDVVLLDRMMPNLGGMEVLARIKRHPVLANCPVILQTARAAAEDVIEGMAAGAYYYLTKPFKEELLRSVVDTAVTDRTKYKKLQFALEKSVKTLRLMTFSRFRFQTPAEAQELASLLANSCPQPSKAVTGFSELLLNAVEHGNLGITYQEKSELNACGQWAQEVERRLNLEEHVDKFVEVEFSRSLEEISVLIKDEGSGFDWRKYLEFSPERAMDTHGRGIAMAGLISFDRIEYNDVGNAVRAYIVSGVAQY